MRLFMVITLAALTALLFVPTSSAEEWKCLPGDDVCTSQHWEGQYYVHCVKVPGRELCAGVHLGENLG